MFWTTKLQQEVQHRFSKEIAAGTPVIIRDEKTMSGRVHVGSLRGVVIHGMLSEFLTAAGVANKYMFEINDFDPMDGLPAYLDAEVYKPHMGKPLCEVPSPDPSVASNYAEYWAAEFMGVVKDVGFTPEYYRASTLYREGKFNHAIRLALDNAALIRKIYHEVSGSEKGEDWLPVQVICENCGRVGTTRAYAWDGSSVTYRCLPDMVKWAEGCGHEGRVDPFDGRAKLPWKVEWPAKFMVVGVHAEGGGKDHYTKGGSRDIARRILAEVFKYPEPIDIPYDFFVVGGKKMSSSKGRGSSAREIADLLPPHMVRFLMMKEPKRPIDFEPYGDTIPILYDQHDKIASEFFAKVDSDWTNVFAHVYPESRRGSLQQVFLPRFSQIAYLVQMPHVDVKQAAAEMKGSPLTEADTAELAERAAYAKHWLQLYSPEKYRFQLQDVAPDATHSFSSDQKKALAMILEFLKQHEHCTGEELHTRIHDIKKDLGIAPADLFSAIYISFLGKDSGPQAGWFLSALPKDFVERRLQEVSAT